jgi:ribosome-associated toxin RatA of RatAB toxin-antitoxin module
MRSSISIDVAASPQLVFALARDVERWPKLLPHYLRVDVEERLDGRGVVARMVARRPLLPVIGIGLPVAWRSRAWSEPERLRLRFAHRGGATDGMSVTWRIEPLVNGSRVTIEHDFRPRFAPWALVVDWFFTRPIASRTLATFKVIAEAVAASTPPESDERRTTNLIA